MSKNIKSIAQNNVGYTGIVKLSQYTKNKKFKIAEIHNEGGKPLFDFLADCLVGSFTEASINRPTKILLLNKEINADGSITYEAAEGVSFIYLLTKPEKVYSETEGIVRYSFIIPQEYFAGDKSRFNAIGLYGDLARYAEDFAACCDVDTSGWSISISSVLVLDWELHIANNFKDQGGNS